MHKHPRITEKRIQNLLMRVREMFYTPVAPVLISAYHVHGEPIPATEALQKNYEPFAVGDAWGPSWDTSWFHFSGKIPDAWKKREVVALVRLGYKSNEGFTVEGLVWRDGKPTGAINVNRAEVPLTKSARGGEEFSFHVEAAANPRAAEHTTNTLMLPEPHGKPLFTLDQAEIACFDRDAYDLYFDLKIAHDAMMALPETNPRRSQLLAALNDAANFFDERTPDSTINARKALREVLGQKNGDTVHQLSAIGHAHIDTAWLWPLRETIRKCARTFSTALAYMEEYPDYVFGCSQAQQYVWMKMLYPEIYERIKKAIKRGQWEPIGSMWIEADCNLSSGESLVRQILHGKNFFLDEFGYETTDVWIPDVFGYCASMPQIMKKTGVKYFLTQKISWNQFNKFPHHTFEWEGIDGTRIFTHFPPADTYNSDFEARQLIYNSDNFRDHDRATRSLYVYGFGDGGGGPTKDMLEIAKRAENFEGLPKVTLEKVCEFFPKAEKDAKDLPRWVGELYLELHRGTYTTQARNKRGNRKSEFLLRDAEFFDSTAAALTATRRSFTDKIKHAVYDVMDGGNAPAALLDRAWKLLLLNQFHDIIPGSSIHWVYRDSDRDYATLSELGRAVLEPAREALIDKINTRKFQQPLVIFNTCSIARDEIVSQADGSPMRVEVPACGYAVVERGVPNATPHFPVTIDSSAATTIIDNGLIQLHFGKEGLIERIYDLRARREVLATGQQGNVFQLHNDFPNLYDAWDVDLFYRDSQTNITSLDAIEIVENTPLRGTLRVVRSFGKSKIVQHISLYAGSPRIDFRTEIDWHEEHKFLKVAFPVNVSSPRATYEIQYGHTERPTHYNTTWDLARFEVCAQKWADLSEGDYGVALLNDCKYGYDIFDNTMRLSLLRAPTAPDPQADRGHQEFVYSLLPHAGDFRAGKVIEESYALNIPLQLVPADVHDGTLPMTQSMFQIDRPGVMIEAIKRAEKEDAMIVRFYEAYGTRGEMTLTTSLPFTKAFTADLMERTLDSVTMESGRITMHIAPFEIVTLKFPMK